MAVKITRPITLNELQQFDSVKVSGFKKHYDDLQYEHYQFTLGYSPEKLHVWELVVENAGVNDKDFDYSGGGGGGYTMKYKDALEIINDAVKEKNYIVVGVGKNSLNARKTTPKKTPTRRPTRK